MLAIRLAGRDCPDAAVAMELELVRWNQTLGQMTERSNTAELIRANHTADNNRPWSWLAEVDGTPVGLLNVLDPDHAGAAPEPAPHLR